MSRTHRVVSILSFLWFAPAVWAQPVSVPPEVLERDWGEEVHCYAGAPKKEGLRLLHTSGYTVGYDLNRRLPAWVAYPLNANQVATETAKRPSRFSSDIQTGSASETLAEHNNESAALPQVEERHEVDPAA